MSNDKPAALSVVFDAIPDSLRSIRRWVVWRYVLVSKPNGDSKWNKMPFQVNGKAAKSTDSQTWTSFDRAKTAYIKGGFDGVGLTFNGSNDIHGIDVDDCVVDGELNSDAKALLFSVNGYAEISPTGTGIKLFTKTNLTGSQTTKGFEVYTNGRYFTVTGHVLAGYEDVADEVQKLDWFIEKHFGSTQSAPNDALALYKPPIPGWDLEKVVDLLLPHLSANCGYGDWIQVGQALYHQGNGDTKWLDTWDNWSGSGATYEEGVCESKWHTFSSQRAKGFGPVTLATLIKKVGDARAEVKKAKFEEWRKKIEEAEDAQNLLTVVCPEIQKDHELDKLGRDVLAQLLKARFKALQYPLMLPDIKRLIKVKATGTGPAWLHEWVFITHEDKFFNVGTKRKVSVMGFNSMFNRELGNGMDDAPKAAVFALETWKIPTPDKVIYLPAAPELFDLNGVPCANSYDPNSVPDIPAAFSAADLQAIETVKSHLKMLLVELGAVDTMLSWMAHNVQKPGVKIRWAPLFKGIEGDGKTVLGKLMSAVMGMVNVGTVSPTVLSTPYTGWAEGRCVNVLEEIRMIGHNRHDVLNMIKPYITNDHVTIHPKGVNEYVAPNTANYLAFTNHQDALPLEETDRRWWVQFSPFTDQAALKSVADGDYFTKLHVAIEQHAGALRRYLLEWTIPASFEPNGQAPYSSAKAKMVSLSMSDDEMAAREVINNGAPGVCAQVISSGHLSTAISLMDGVDLPKTTAVNRLLMKLGYSKLPRVVKWSGLTCRLWIKGYLMEGKDDKTVNEELRALLDMSLVDPFLD
jgi:hypothetical protein